ncbi:serine protease [Streptomyces sp. NBC_00454]|uniref:serine protease n=1 Tax=Streptomyces sp. NBC_00454 TaxID=2975747 RepID=UPI0030E37E87
MTTNFPVPIPRSALGRGLLALGAALASALLVLTGSTQAHAIVGGYEAKPLQFPSVLALQKNGQLICGATLIKPGWALTSAACTTGSAPSQLKVVSGALALTDLSIPGITTVQVAQIVLHPDYAASDGRNNIALLKLNTPLVAVPAALPQSGAAFTGTVTAVGWGATREGGQPSPTLRYVNTQVVPRSTCRSQYGTGAITDSMICAGVDAGGKGTCKGDGGGPLYKNGTVIGIVSHANGCARAGSSDILTNVASFRTWIDSKTA